jgi:CAAX prenyl protease-like protein
METQTDSPSRKLVISDDTAYYLPMAAFLVILWIGSQAKWLYVPAYALRTVVAAALLWGLRKHYTKIRWNGWWLGVIVGVVGIFQWVGMQLWLERHFAWFRPSPDAFNPKSQYGAGSGSYLAFVAMRMVGAVLVVPFMEELFWRDYLWRFIIAPNNFKLARVGEWDWKAFLFVAMAFSTVHGNWFATAIVWGLMIGALLVYTKSLGACIIAHAVTNLLLAVYVLQSEKWGFW